MSKALLNHEDYRPKNLLDEIMTRSHLKNDAALSRFLDVPAPVVCKIRQKRIAISGDMLLRIHDYTGISISDLRELAGIPKYDAPAGEILTRARPETVEA